MTSPFFSTQDFLNGKNNSNGWGISPELILKAYQQNPEQTNNAMRTIPIIRNDVREKLGLPPLHTPTVEVDAPFQKLPQNVLNVQTPTVAEENPTSNGLSQQPVNPLPTPQPQSSQENQFQTPTAPQTEKPTQEDVSTRVSLDTLNATQNQPSQPDSFELARLASGNINNNNLGYINEIIAAKNAWGNATTDADRKAAADYATHIRNLAEMRNIGLGAFGDGNNLTTEQANLAWGNYVLDEAEKYQNKFQAVQDNLKNNYGENSNDHFWRLYDEYRQQGDSDRTAAIKAGRETMGYQQERTQTLQSAIDDYGIEGGVMNQFGVSLLGQLAEEDNIMGSAYANAYATPKLNFEKQQAMAQEILKQNSANQRKLAEMQYNAALQEMLENGRNVRTDAKNQTTKEVTQFKEDRADARADKIEKGKNDRFNISEENKFKLAEHRAKLKEITEKNSGGSDKEKYSKLKDLQTRVHQQLKDAQAEDEPDEEYIEELKNDLKYIDRLTRTFQDPALQIEYPDATGNPQEDEKIAIEMWKNGATSDDIRIWFNASEKYDANTITKIIRKIMG